jgi:hypothetical protein
MTAPRPRSPLAHDAGDDCGACRDCPSCAGGAAPPTRYLVTPDGPVCTVCAGRGRTCHNLAPALERTTVR